MSLQATLARSSRVTKPRRKSALQALGIRRSTSSPSTISGNRKSSTSSKQAVKEEEDDELLDDTGAIASLASDLHFRDVPQYMQYIRDKMFSPIPERAAGMNSTRIAEVLNFRNNLPGIVTIAHIDALSASPTKTEREIAELAQAGVVRSVIVPRSETGSAAVGEGLALVSEWQQKVLSSELSPELQAKYISLMNANPTSGTVAGNNFTQEELSALTTAGFLTTPTIAGSPSLFVIPGSSSLASLATAGSRHAAGTLGAVGGAGATQYMAGGGMSRQPPLTYYNFSLPNTGAHIKLLVQARTHLINLLKKSKYKEAPMDVLRERWDGGVSDSDKVKRGKGEFTGVLPGRTKKWKQFWGLRFEWILEECVGAGLVECFETRSVGVGVRLVR